MAVLAMAKKRANDAAEIAQNGVEQAADTSRRAARQTRDYARHHPWKTAGAVTGALALAGAAGYAIYQRRSNPKRRRKR